MSRELERNQDATCYVGNLDDRVTDELMWELMYQAGQVVHVFMPKDRISQLHQGFAFAEYYNESDAQYACLILNGIKLFGKPIRVNMAAADTNEPMDIGANLFVGNLDSSVDERTLMDTFGTFGTILGTPKIARDPTTNESKNYGFVSFDSFEAADAAIESLHNQYLVNRPMTVSYAEKKDARHGEKHGSAAERLVAAQARKNQVLGTLHEANGSYATPTPAWTGEVFGSSDTQKGGPGAPKATKK